MVDEVGTEATRPDGQGTGESLFGDTAGKTPTAEADGQDSGEETAPEQQDAGEEASQDAQVSEDAGDEAAPQEDLKVVMCIKGGRATIGVQQPSSDPHIETVDDPDLCGVVGEVPAVIGRAKAKWEESPKHPAYERPAPPPKRRTRRGQGATQALADKGEAERTEQAQQQTLRLF